METENTWTSGESLRVLGTCRCVGAISSFYEGGWHLCGVCHKQIDSANAFGNNAALDRLARANSHRPKLWMCPDCHVRCRVENAQNHADTCHALQQAAKCDESLKPEAAPMRNTENPSGVQALGPTVNSDEMSLDDNLFMLRGLVGDLRRGFSRVVNPERWVADTQAFIDRIREQAQRANVSAATRSDSVVAKGVTLPVGEKPALKRCSCVGVSIDSRHPGICATCGRPNGYGETALQQAVRLLLGAIDEQPSVALSLEMQLPAVREALSAPVEEKTSAFTHCRQCGHIQIEP